MTGICLARILRPHGRRGEVRAAVLTDFPERLLGLRRALLAANDAPRPVLIRSCRLEPSRRFALFAFEGCHSIDDARRFVGLEIQVPADERLALPRGSHYVADLVGCQVVEAATGRSLGLVRDVISTGEEIPGTPLLAVAGESRGELLVPLAADICREIDTAARRILVVLPEGLAELNRG